LHFAAVQPHGLSDNANQPEDQDQDQDSAKTDIHAVSPLLVLMMKPSRHHHGCSRFGSDMTCQGIILPVQKVPDLLDF